MKAVQKECSRQFHGMKKLCRKNYAGCTVIQKTENAAGGRVKVTVQEGLHIYCADWGI